MYETFHPFPRLPPELRLAIWKLAVRNDGSLPGAHFFGILITNQDKDADSLVGQSLRSKSREYSPSYGLIGPRWKTTSTEDRFVGIKKEPASWTNNNPSTYMADSGLWLACRESWHFIKHAVQYSYRCKVPMPPQNDALPDRFIVFHRQEDLFCFQPYDWYTWSLDHGFDSFLAVTFDRFLENTAIEYNPQWGIELEEAGGYHGEVQIFDTFFYLAIDSSTESRLGSVWFIDYRIKRRHHVPTKEQSEAPLGKVFYQQGRRFVEVDIECEDSPWEQSYEVTEGKWTYCKTFVLALRQACQDQIDHGEENFGYCEDTAPFLGVLACEDY